VSTSLRSRIRQGVLLGCVSGAALFALAVGQASAITATSVVVDSTFDSGVEGWTAAANEQNSLLGGPLCIEGLTCPQVTDEYHATEGVGKSGYIETKEGGLLAVGLLAESRGNWESPAFTYTGVGGQRPTKVELAIARRAQLTDLLSLPGASATYTVELVDKTTPSGTVVVVNGATLAGAEEWKSASTAISPSLLIEGNEYKVRIRTAFVTPAALVPAGGVGYDNVELTANRSETEEGPKGPEGPEGPQGPGGDNGSNGSNGTNGAGGNAGPAGADGTNGSNGTSTEGNGGAGGAKGANGSGGPSVAELREAIGSQGLSPTASLKRGKLTITGMCPKSIDGACTVRIKGMLTKTKVATSSGRAHIAQGGKHRFIVAVNPKAANALKTKGKLLVKEWVRVGTTRAVLYKQVKVVAK
jgi:hypothetical protein